MGKMKVYELAEELGMQSKELVEKLIDLKYDIKNHMSILEEADIDKIRKQLKVGKEPKKDNAKKEKKPIAPVIIRREITRIETEEPETKKDTKRPIRDDLGVVQRRTDASMNIKYRTPPKKIASITPKEEPKEKAAASNVEHKTIEKPEIKKVEEKKVVESIEEKPVEKKEIEKEKVVEKVTVVNSEKVETEKKEIKREENKKPYNRFENRNNDNQNRNQRPYNNRPYQDRDGKDRNQNRQGEYRKDYNNGRDNKFGNKGDNRGENRPFNKDSRRPNGQGSFNKQNQSRENKIEKGIKDVIASSEAATKEPVREIVRTGYKDKEKDNRKFEEPTKKVSKSKVVREMDEDINFGKLKDLQSESNFSNMFNDTESKMFDYYDLSNRQKGFKKNKKKPTESREHIEQKIFELTDIEIPETITVKELAEKLKKQASEVIKKLLGYGILATLNNELDFDTVTSMYPLLIRNSLTSLGTFRFWSNNNISKKTSVYLILIIF